jgi:uncharacterized protein YdaU (DUF1376 family)
MPVYIGDYLADTMHLSKEQHGAYLLLLFHLWRRGVLRDDDVVPAQITGLDPIAWSNTRALLAEFFEIQGRLWHHGRVEQERSRLAAKQQSNSNQAKPAAYRRWNKACTPGNTPGDGKSKSQSEPELLRTIPCSNLAYEKQAGMLDILPCAQFGQKIMHPPSPPNGEPGYE